MKEPPIGILSGTFDPVHLGHIKLATSLYKSCDLQKITLIPCHQSPLKSLPLVNSEDRINMLKIATAELPYIDFEEYEIKSPTISYTIKTLQYLRQKHPNTPLALIMGTDVLNRFDEWHKWQEILKISHLLVANRHNQEITNPAISSLLRQNQVFDQEELQKKPHGLIYLADFEPLPISATMIRDLIAHKKETEHLLNPKVLQYIIKKNLYK